jgi:hypothetical protein
MMGIESLRPSQVEAESAAAVRVARPAAAPRFGLGYPPRHVVAHLFLNVEAKFAVQLELAHLDVSKINCTA